MLSTATANTTTDPPWKAEILQKKSEKLKNDSIPKWKIELLKRLKDKAQAAELKMAAEAKKSEDKLVLDEPILKVSENIFMRKELERKVSANQLSKKSDVTGRLFTRKEKMVIIENNDPTDDAAAKQSDDELPTMGIVSRLKGWFGSGQVDTKPLSHRSKSSDDLLKIDYSDERRPSAPTFTSHLSTNYKQFKKFPSVDSAASRPLKPALSKENINSSFLSKNLTSSSRTELENDDKVDLNSLHASVSIERPSDIQKSSQGSDVSRERPKLSDRTQEFTKSTVTLHASSCDNDKINSNKEDLLFVPETITLTSPSYANRSFDDVAKKKESNKKNAENVTSIDDVVTDRVLSKAVQPSQLMSNNKENIPEVPKRRSTPITTSRNSPTKKGANTSQSDNPYIVELGRISMDPSQLKSKAAIAANEIMKQSRTFKIVPKGKNQDATSDVLPTVKSDRVETKETLNMSKTPASSSIAKELENSQIKSAGIENENKLPASSIDDVIAEGAISAAKTEKPNSTSNSTLKSANENEPIKPVEKPANNSSSFTPKSNVGRNFTISSSSERVVSQRSSEKNAAVNNLFGSKLSSVRSPSKSGFSGRGTFVIDPSKFKKSAARQSPAPIVQSAPSTKSTSASPGTRVIVPKSQSEPTPTGTSVVEEDGAAVKGKRKLTVDQIIVVGGYVKLDRSSLSKPNKIRKGNRVKFEENQLESVYQYPSESSLLKEEHENQLNERMTSLNSKPGIKKESQLGKYTPKYLLAMAQQQLDQVIDDDDGEQPAPDPSPSEKVVVSDLATPLRDEDAATFSSSTSSSDLLF